MTNQEIVEMQRKMQKFRETEIGGLFEKFVNLHAKAWQLDERSSNGYGEIASRKAWEQLKPVEQELRKRLMKIAGVES